jgi:hypothetical protein
MFNIDPVTIKKAAIEKYGEGVLVSEPYWVDHECVRIGIQLPNDGASFGANFYYKQNKFI